MQRFKKMMLHLIKGISKAVLRFPLTVLCLVVAAGLACYLIWLKEYPAPLLIEKLIYTLVIGSLTGMLAQFSTERFAFLGRKRALAYGVAIVLSVGYFLILWPAPEISNEITVRSFVAAFSLFCGVLFVPSMANESDFNRIPLIHFKSFFTSLLYSGVLSGGLSAIIFAIDTLLFSLNDDTYAYTMILVWIVFAPVYFLSLLPKFNTDKEDELAETTKKSDYPKFLEILVSYIATPLFTAYTLVLFAYFAKILITREWPSGQLGPMVLAYSAIGILLFILSALLENRFSHWYRMLFPKVLIPVVIMQMVAVWIRIDAYGITESRYYISLFAIFSIASGIVLSIWPKGKNGIVLLMSAGFALFSIIPPVDAFTVSRNSQINILETYLTSEGMLVDGTITPKADVSENVRSEITNKINYLSRTSSFEYIEWLPADFEEYKDFKDTFGFDPFYKYYGESDQMYFHAEIDPNKTIDISGYDVSILINAGRFGGNVSDYSFSLDGQDYQLLLDSVDDFEIYASVVDSSGSELIGTGFYEFAKQFKETESQGKGWLSPEAMSLETVKNGYRMKVVFQWVDISEGPSNDRGANYSAFIFFAAPK